MKASIPHRRFDQLRRLKTRRGARVKLIPKLAGCNSPVGRKHDKYKCTSPDISFYIGFQGVGDSHEIRPLGRKCCLIRGMRKIGSPGSGYGTGPVECGQVCMQALVNILARRPPQLYSRKKLSHVVLHRGRRRRVYH